MSHENNYFLGNPHVKRVGVEQNWTKESIQEYAKCLKDPNYFARNYVKIINLNEGLVTFALYPYQANLLDHFHENRFSICLASRQSGKCLEKSSKIRVKNKTTGEILELTMEDFHEMLKIEKS